MSFLHPALLWLVPLAAIPIVLHLLTLHRLKTVELSTYRFLFDSYIQQRRQMRFLEALLAMLRTLFLLGLIFVVCRPAVRHWNELFRAGGAGRDVVLMLDCSASMNAITQGKTAFKRAKEAALSVIDRLHPEDRVTLIRVGNKPEEVFSRFSSDVASIREKLDLLKTSPGRGNVFAALLRLFGSEGGSRGGRIVYLFTDCQESGWKEVRNQGLERLIPSETEFIVANVGSAEPLANLAIIGDAPRRQRAIVGLPILLQPRIANYAPGETADATLSVLIDDKEIARAPLTLKPGEVATRKVFYTPTEPGIHRGRFEITGKTHDRFPDDDRYRFTLAVTPRVKVLLVNGRPAADPLDSETLYLFTALTSPNDTAKSAEPARGQAPAPSIPTGLNAGALDVQEIQEGNVNPATLQEAGVVVLANCGRLSGQQFAWLRDYVAAGGGLIILPGDQVNPESYNQQLFPAPGPQNERLTGVEFGKPDGDPDKADTYERLAVDFAHPILSVFDDPAAGYFRQVQVKRRFPLVAAGQGRAEPGKSGNRPTPPGTLVLAEFTTGALALVESRFHEGTVVVGSFPAHPKWTNLPLKAGEFVPLMLRLVSFTARRPAIEAPSVVPPDSAAEVTITAGVEAVAGKVTDPSGKVFPLEFERSISRLAGAFDRTGEAGYYSIAMKSSRADDAPAESAAFAVNLAPEESEFTTLNEKQLRELLPLAQLTVVDASAEAQQLHGSIGNEREIWRPLIWLMFIVIGAEFTLATLGGQRPETGETPTVTERILQARPGGWVGRLVGRRTRE